MSVVLVDPKGPQRSTVNVGLGYLAGALVANKINVQILNLNNALYDENDVIRVASDCKPHIIGVSVKTATAVESANLLQTVRRVFPQVTLVAGGPHITLLHEEFLMENRFVDYAVVGEGELSLVELYQMLADGHHGVTEIPGIAHVREDNVLHKERQPIQDISDLPYPRYDADRDMGFTDFVYPLLSSRGCPYSCIFCSVPILSGKRFRSRSPEDVLAELEFAEEKYGISAFELIDDNFSLDMDRAKAICQRIIRSTLQLEWRCLNGIRADRFDEELASLMKESGCRHIAFGIETGDPEVFARIKKGESLTDIVRAVRIAQKVGLETIGHFIIGLPGDNLRSTRRSVAFLKSLKLQGWNFNILVPYPGTEVWSIVHEQGRTLTDVRKTRHYKFENDKPVVSYELPGFPKNDVERAYRLARKACPSP